MPLLSKSQTSRTPQIVQTSGMNVKKPKKLFPPRKMGNHRIHFIVRKVPDMKKVSGKKRPKIQKKTAQKSRVLSQIFSSDESEDIVDLGNLIPNPD
jgi:hypothetical protein